MTTKANHKTQLAKQNQTKSDCLYFSISKDKAKPALNGYVHNYETHALLSTNGYVLTHLSSRYSPDISDKIINPTTGEIIEREYPRVSLAIPTTGMKSYFHYKKSEHYKPERKAAKPPRLYFIQDEITEELKAIHQEDMPKERLDNNNYLFCINAHFLKPLRDNTIYLVQYNGQLNPILINLTNGTIEFKDFYLIMPMKGDM